MQENENKIAETPTATVDLQEKERILKEIEKIKRRDKFLRIFTFVMGFIMVCGFFLVYWAYKKAKEYKPLLDTAKQMAEESAAFMEANKIQAMQIESSYNVQPSSKELTSSSLSMIKFGEELASKAEDNPQAREELSAVVQEYKETPEMKEMMEEFKKDPEMKKVIESMDPSNPMAAMSKMKDPAVMKKVMEMMIKNPKFISNMLKMASDPRVSNAMNSHRQEKPQQSTQKE